MPAIREITTIEELLALPEDGMRHELLDGEGVGQYWVVDIDARLIERWTPTDDRPEILSNLMSWSLPGGATGEVDVATFFDRALA